MGLTFDITTTPPDAASIAAARAQLAAERLRLRAIDKRYIAVAIAVVAAIQVFVFLVVIPTVSGPGSTEGGIVFILVYSIPYLFFAVFVVGCTKHHYQVDVPRKALRAAEAALQDATQEDIDTLRDAFQAHALLDTYRTQVASQGRALFKGELDAMRRWLDGRVVLDDQVVQAQTESGRASVAENR